MKREMSGNRARKRFGLAVLLTVAAVFVAAAVMLMSVAPAATDRTVGAVGDTFTDGNFTFKVTSESPDEVTLTGYVIAPTGHLNIPSTAESSGRVYTVTSIEDRATASAGVFYNCAGLTSVTVPDPVKRIGSFAFRSCADLVSADLGSVTSMGDYPFAATGLTSVTIPGSVTSVGVYAFTACNALGSVTMDGSPALGDYMFQACGELSSVDLGSVTSIPQCMFVDCVKLETVEIPDTVTSIGFVAFNGCSTLRTVTIPASVAQIDMMAFRVTAITAVALPADVAEGFSAFPAAAVKVYYKDVPTVTAVRISASEIGLVIPEPTGKMISEVVLEDYVPSTKTVTGPHDRFPYGGAMSFDPSSKMNFLLTADVADAFWVYPGAITGDGKIFITVGTGAEEEFLIPVYVIGGTDVTFRAEANAPSSFSEWTGLPVTTDNPYTMAVDSERTVGAIFLAPVMITITPGTITGDGKIFITVGTGAEEEFLTPVSVISGTDVTFRAEANAPSSFSEWTGLPATTGNPYTMAVDSERTVGAVFIAPVMILITPGTITGDGKIFITVGTGAETEFLTPVSVISGTEVTFRAEANAPSSFSQWTGLPAATGNPYTFAVNSERTVGAVFIAPGGPGVKEFTNDGGWPLWLIFLLAAAFLLLLILWPRRVLIVVVKCGDTGVAGAEITYNADGETGSATTSGSGVCGIPVPNGTKVTISLVRTPGHTISGTALVISPGEKEGIAVNGLPVYVTAQKQTKVIFTATKDR